MDSCRLLTTWELDAGLNMALDELQLASGAAPLTLRFYTWKPWALSLGYFQRVAEVGAAVAALAARAAAAPALPTVPSLPTLLALAALPTVRRLTGGGAIHHAEELTYSLAGPAEHALFAGPIADSYGRVHLAIAAALAELGVASELRGARALRSDVPGTGMCFHASSALDLVREERKLVGSAQRRTKGRVLHHGSIKLRASALEPGVAELPECAAPELAERLARAFARELALDFRAQAPEERELELAAARAPFYASDAHLKRR